MLETEDFLIKTPRTFYPQGSNISKKKSSANASKECDICHYWYFKDIGFRYEPCLCNGYHDLMQKARVLMMLLLFMLKEGFAEFIFGYMDKDDAINIMNNSDLVHKKGVL